MDFPTRHLEDPARFGAMAAALFSAVGYAGCLLLSVIKLRTEHQCSSLIDTVCADRCARTLHDAWSSVWGLPVTVYGCALYLVAFALACRASSGEPGRWLSVPLLGLAGFIFSVSILYATYAVFGLSTWCDYCALLYATSVGLLLGAALVIGTRSTGRPLLKIRTWTSIGLTALGVATSIVAHANLYARLASQDPGQNCRPRDIFDLPQPFLRVPASAPPQVVAAVFIDFSCPHCRTSVDFWRDYQAARRDLLELRFYHFPADCDGPSQNYACDAARAYACLAPADPDHGFEVLEQIFALQDGPPGYFNTENLRAVAARLGIKDFDACKVRPDLAEAVDTHIEFAGRNGLAERPAALLIRMIENQPAEAVALQGASKDTAFLDRNIRHILNPNAPWTP